MQVSTVDYLNKHADKEFASSMQNTGFAVIKNHSIAESLITQVYREWQQFFASATKYDYLFDYEKHDGFFPAEQSEVAKGYSVKDLKEFYHVYPWGRMPAMIGASTMQLFHQLHELAVVLLHWLEKFTPPEIAEHYSMPLSNMVVDSPLTLFRILHYPPLPEHVPAGAVRAAAHGDINFITLLPAATDMGLQVKDNQDNWHEVNCDYGTIVINVADMLQRTSRNYYRSTLHRVVNPEGEAAKRSRLSMPLFLHGRPEVLIDDNTTVRDYWLERLQEIGLK